MVILLLFMLIFVYTYIYQYLYASRCHYVNNRQHKLFNISFFHIEYCSFNYQFKMVPGKRRPYSPSKLAEAVAAVKSGMSIRDAESEFGMPKSTIRDNAAGDHINANIGQPPELNKVEESMLKEFVKLLADWGFPFTSAHLWPLCEGLS
jgi:hypothetical protein